MFPPVHVADIAQHEGKEVTLHGWLYNRRSSGQAPLPPGPRRHRHHPVRRLQGQRDARGLPRGRSPAAGDEPRRHRAREEGRALAHRLRARRPRPQGRRPADAGVPDRPQGARRRLPHGAAPPLAALPAAARDPARAPHDRSRRSATSSTSAASRSSTRRSSRRPPARGRRTLFEVPYFDLGKAYLTQSGQLYMEAGGHGARQGLLLRPDLPRREVEDAPPPRPSSGWSSPRSPSWTSTATWSSRRTSSRYVVADRAREAPQRSSRPCSSATSRSSRA